MPQPPRTSASHPLRIDWVPAAAGRLGMTFCPGKRQADAATGAWERDLGADLAAIHTWGARALVTLNEASELAALAVGGGALEREAGRLGLDWLHLPIPDAGVPDAGFEASWGRAGVWLRDQLRRGRDLVVHCKGGLGRTGMVAARLLVELGEAPEAAIARVRAARPGAIETRAQEEHVRAARASPEPEYPDRVAGCLLAGAVGDALGAGIEFDSLAAIRARFGPRGVTGYVPAYGRRGALTDDTQMTLFTVEGLIRAWARGREKGVCHPPAVVWHAYHRWLVTQGDAAERVGRLHFARGHSPWPDGWLVSEPRLHSARAPGNTCLSALRSGKMGTPLGAHPAAAEPLKVNDSKGCGGVMRAAPAGLVRWPLPAAFGLGADVAAITHGHPSGYLAAGVLAATVAALVEGATVGDALELARRELAGRQGNAETAAALDAAVALAARGTPAPEQLEALGGGWVAEEALAIAVCCALAGERLGSPREALLLAVNHSGDSDSTGAITGNLLGALWGRGGAPDDLLGGLELRDVVEALAEDLVREVLGVVPPGEEWGERYPGW